MGLINWMSKGLKFEKKETEAFDQPEITLNPPADSIGEQSEFILDEPEPIFEKPTHLNNNHAFEQQRSFDQMLGGQTIGNRTILVVVPHTNQDVNNIVANLQNNEACVIDFEQIPLADAQRRLDFLSGVICAINGSIRPLDKHKYILTPHGMSVKQMYK